MKTFELNLTHEELEKRTHKDYLAPKIMLKADAVEYNSLEEGDKIALNHLVKAANIIDKVFMMMDNHDNIEFLEYLKTKAAENNVDAKMTLKLFLAQRGMNAIDTESNKIFLAKGSKELPGKAFYPSDLEIEEFHDILIQMLEKGLLNEVKTILNQRSIVERDGDILKGTDYTEKFKTEFEEIAQELEKASKVSTDKNFNEYLVLQAKALRENDPMLDAYADKKWATLQDTPLEFTISREQYADRMSGTVVENEKLRKLLEDNKIEALSKDSLGCRVGIVNKKGTQDLLKIKDYIPLIAKNMPFADCIKSTFDENNSNQTMVDVDLVTVTGDEGAFRAGITLAQNLPNDDKLSLTIGGGRRNVYHRQIRVSSQPEKVQKRLDAILSKEFHKFYNEEADHWFTIGHENMHSFMPKDSAGSLGKFRNIIEENKADVGAIAFLDLLEKEGMYTNEQKIQIIVSFATNNFLKSKPNLDQAHRVRSVMQTHYLMEHGAVRINDEGKIHIEIDKVVPTARKMLEEILKIQISQDLKQAQIFVEENFQWNDDMENIGKQLREVNKTLNGIVEAPLAEKLAEKD